MANEDGSGKELSAASTTAGPSGIVNLRTDLPYRRFDEWRLPLQLQRAFEAAAKLISWMVRIDAIILGQYEDADGVLVYPYYDGRDPLRRAALWSAVDSVTAELDAAHAPILSAEPQLAIHGKKYGQPFQSSSTPHFVLQYAKNYFTASPRGREEHGGLWFREHVVHRNPMIGAHEVGHRLEAEATAAATSFNRLQDRRQSKESVAREPRKEEAAAASEAGHDMRSARDWASDLGVNYDALRNRLNRLRLKRGDLINVEWIEAKERGPRQPQYVYTRRFAESVARKMRQT